jgi:hypothetical protein
MNTYQNLKLHEWISLGCQGGFIRQLDTVMLAYLMDEREAMAWIADLVAGIVSESEAIRFMRRVVENAERQYAH